MKGMRPVYRLKWGPLPLNEVTRIAQHVKKREGKETQTVELLERKTFKLYGSLVRMNEKIKLKVI